ncbi:MAG: helix-turn-helix domain-containing protein [Ignavibacteria bacterium]|nr:helix-turn-helix domain-containing protein [Ignavibacteria bacterium]
MDPLAERFRRERERLGISIRELALETKIREPYIDALERGRYDVLPAVYVRSFIRTIGTSLQIPADEIKSLMDATFDDEGSTSGRLPASSLSNRNENHRSRSLMQPSERQRQLLHPWTW